MKNLLKSKKILLVFMVLLLSCCVAAVAGAASFNSNDYIATGSATVSKVSFDGEIDSSSELTSTDNLYKVVFTANAAGEDTIDKPNAIKAINVVLSYDPAVITPIDAELLISDKILYEATGELSYAVYDLKPQAGDRASKEYGMAEPLVTEVDDRVVLELTSKYDADPVSAGDKSFFEFYFQVSDISKLNATSIMIETDRGENSILDKLTNFAEFCERRGNFAIADTLTTAPAGYSNNVKFSIDPDEINAADENNYYPTYLLDFAWNVPENSGFDTPADPVVTLDTANGNGGGFTVSIEDPNPSYIDPAKVDLVIYSDEGGNNEIGSASNVENGEQITDPDMVGGETYYVDIYADDKLIAEKEDVVAGFDALLVTSTNSLDLGSVTYGYTEEVYQNLIFSNYDTTDATVILALGAVSPFEISVNDAAVAQITVPANGGSKEVSVCLKSGLGAGEYTDTLSFSFAGGEGSVALKAVVAKAPIYIKASDQKITFDPAKGTITDQLADAVQVYENEACTIPVNGLIATGVNLQAVNPSKTKEGYSIEASKGSLKLTSGSDDVTKNYNVEDFIDGELTVTHYQPKLEAGVTSVTYDGAPVEAADFEIKYADSGDEAKLADAITGVTYSETAPQNVGDYKLTIPEIPAVYTADVAFAAVAAQTVDFEIAPGDVTITAKDQTIAYGGSIDPDDYEVEGLADGHKVVYVDLNLSTDEVTDNGTITPEKNTIKIEDAKGNEVPLGNYSPSCVSGILVITKAEAAFEELKDEYSVIYSGKQVDESDVTYDYTGDDSSVVSIKWYDAKGNPLPAAPSDAGSYQVGFSASAGTNYNAVDEVKKPFTIKPLAVEIVWPNDNSYEFDGSKKTHNAAIQNKISGDNVELIYKENTNTAINAGSYVAEIEGVTNTNYTIDGVQNTTCDWSIVAKELDVTDIDVYLYSDEEKTIPVDENTYSYDGNAKEPYFMAFDGNTEITAFLDAVYSDNVNAGTAKVTFTFNKNYVLKDGQTLEKTFVINKALAPQIDTIELKAAYSQVGYVSDQYSLFELAPSLKNRENLGEIKTLGFVIADPEPAFVGISCEVWNDGYFKVGYSYVENSGAIGESVRFNVFYDTQNYGNIIVPFILTLTAKTTVTLSAPDYTFPEGRPYNGTALEVTKNGSVVANGASSDDNVEIEEYWVVKSDDGSWKKADPVNAGTYRYVAKVKDSDDLYTSALTPLSDEIVISKVEVTVTAENKEIIYGAAKDSFGFSAEFNGFVNDEDKSYPLPFEGDLKFSCSYEQGSVVGKYTITPVVTGLSADNYDFNPVAGTLTVKQRPVTIVAGDQTIPYGTSTIGDTNYGVSAETPLLAGHKVSATLTVNGTSINISYVEIIDTNTNGGVTANYEVTTTPGTLSFSAIDPDVTVTAKDDIVYDGNAVTAGKDVNNDITVSVPDDYNGDITYQYAATGGVSLNWSETAPKDAGDYKVKVNGAAEAGKYNEFEKIADFTIKPLPVEVTWPEQTALAYNGSEQTFVATINNKVAGDDVDLTYSGNTEKEVGSYTAEITGVTNDNYTIDGMTGDKFKKWSIVAAVLDDIIIELDKTSFVYNGSNQAPAVNVYLKGVDGNKTGENIADKFTIVIPQETKNVGTYNVTVKTKAGSDYALNGEKTVSFAITALPVEITWSTPTTFTYDGTAKTVTPSVTNACGTDNVDLTVTGNTETEVGSYTAKITGVSNSNYTTVGVTNLEQAWKIIPAEADMKVTIAGYTTTAVFDEAVGQELTAKLGENDKYSTLSYQWYRDGVEISGAASAEYTLKAADLGTVISVTVTSTGNYKGSGEAEKQIFATNPDAVSNLQLDADEESVTAEWSAPADGGSDITKYIVTLTDEDGNEVDEAETTDTDYTFEDLDPETEYTVTVVAVNGIGESDPVSDTIETDDGEDSKKESDLDISTKGDTTTADVNNDRNNVTITEKDMDDLIDEVQDEDPDHVVIEAEDSESVTLPSDAAKDLGKEDVDLTIELEEGDVYFSNAALRELGKGKLVVKLTASSGDCHPTKGDLYELTITLGGKPVTLQNPVCVEIPHNSGAYTIAENEDGTVRLEAVWEAGIMHIPATGAAEFHVYNNQKFFSDMTANHAWAQYYVDFASARGMFKGMTETTFGPANTMTREMFITVLYRMAGSPAVYGGSNFNDVVAGKYYETAVIWAVENNIISERTGSFGVGQNITRQDMVTWLHNFAVYEGLNTVVTSDLYFMSYSDVSSVADYAMLPFQWAVDNGIVNGRTTTTLVPLGSSTRAEVATILTRYIIHSFEMELHEL